MYSLVLLLASLTLSADVRTVGCNSEWKSLCSLNNIETLALSLKTDVTNNGLDATLQTVDDGQYFTADERAKGYFPWVVELPDTTEHGLAEMTPVNLNSMNDANTAIVATLNGDGTFTTVTLGTTSNPQDEVVYSVTLDADHIASVMTESCTRDLTVCTGETESPCNVFVASTTFANVKYDLATLGSSAVMQKFNNLEYDSDSFCTVLLQSDGTWSGNENATTTWFNAGEIENYREIAFTDNSVTYEGWAYPLEVDGVNYQVAMTYTAATEEVLPESTWESLTLTGSCPPNLYHSSCSDDYMSVILGSIEKDALSETGSYIIGKFNNGDYNEGDWAPELRSIADGSLVASDPGSLLDPIPTDKEIFLVASQALSQSSDGGWVEFTTSQGPYRTYVIPVLSDYYAQVGYINSHTTAPTPSPTRTPDDSSSSSSWSLITLVAVITAVVFGY